MKTIDDVLAGLDSIIAQSIRTNSRQAYFAALYRAMTQSVKNAINRGYFEDAPRMEKLDIIFAKRYIDAWNCYQKKQPCSLGWKTAFDACENNNLIVLQHLVLGINTHINLDLAIAAAETCPGDSIHSLKTDFERINALIATLTDEVQARLETIWWPMKMIKRLVNSQEKAVINFSIDNARKASWANAVALAIFDGPARLNYIGGVDRTVNEIAGRIIEPGWMLKMIIKTVKQFEYNNVNQVITVLNKPLKS